MIADLSPFIGAIAGGDRVLIMPAAQSAQVKSVAVDEDPIDYGFAGDQVVVTLIGVNETVLCVGKLTVMAQFTKSKGKQKLRSYDSTLNDAVVFQSSVIEFAYRLGNLRCGGAD